MNKKIMMSALSIMSALTIMGGATFAAFTATDTVQGNTFAAGTLILDAKVGGNSTSPAFTVTNAAPGQTYDQVIELANTGSTASTQTSLVDITSTGASTPDLADVLMLSFYDDATGSVPNAWDAGDTLLGGPASLNSSAWANIPFGFGITAGGSHKVIARITVDPNASDVYQGKDAGSFNFIFSTSQ